MLQSNPGSSTYKRLVIHRTYILFYNILTIPSLQRSNRGLYKCSVRSGDKVMQQVVSVTVYGECCFIRKDIVFPDEVTKTGCCILSLSDRPFIRLKPQHGSEIEVQAGQKSYRISPKLRAFPPPEIIW